MVEQSDHERQYQQVKESAMSNEILDDLENLPTACKFLLIYARKNMNRSSTVEVPLKVFGYIETMYIPQEDIIQFCRMEEISAICVVFYIRLVFFFLVTTSLLIMLLLI